MLLLGDDKDNSKVNQLIGHGLRPITLSHWVAPMMKQYCEAKDDRNQYVCAKAPT
jgi:hypothetical protein